MVDLFEQEEQSLPGDFACTGPFLLAECREEIMCCLQEGNISLPEDGEVAELLRLEEHVKVQWASVLLSVKGGRGPDYGHKNALGSDPTFFTIDLSSSAWRRENI